MSSVSSTNKPLHDVLRSTVRKMVRSVGQNENGNIYHLVVTQAEKCLIEIVLEEFKNNYFHTARVLGIGRSTLYRKISLLGIEGRRKALDYVEDEEDKQASQISYAR